MSGCMGSGIAINEAMAGTLGEETQVGGGVKFSSYPGSTVLSVGGGVEYGGRSAMGESGHGVRDHMSLARYEHGGEPVCHGF